MDDITTSGDGEKLVRLSVFFAITPCSQIGFLCCAGACGYRDPSAQERRAGRKPRAHGSVCLFADVFVSGTQTATQRHALSPRARTYAKHTRATHNTQARLWATALMNKESCSAFISRRWAWRSKLSVRTLAVAVAVAHLLLCNRAACWC